MTHRSPISTKEAAVYLGLRANHLEKIRMQDGGPVFLKLGGTVRYLPDDLDIWLNSHRQIKINGLRTTVPTIPKTV